MVAQGIAPAQTVVAGKEQGALVVGLACMGEAESWPLATSVQRLGVWDLILL